MTGLTLVCDFSGRPVRSTILARLETPQAANGLLSQTFSPSPSIWIRNLARPVGGAPVGAVPSPNRVVYVVVHGEVYNADQLAKLCGKTSPIPWTIADGPELVAAGIEQLGTSFVEQVNGSFTLAAWFPRRQRLYVANDRYGLRPHYLMVRRNTLLMAPTLHELISCMDQEPSLNPLGIAELAVFEQLMGNKTLVESIEVLPPAGVYQLNPSGIVATRYWNFPFQEPASSASESTLRDELQDRLVTAVRRQLPTNGTLGSLLSGGLDSRVLASIAAREIESLPTFTYGLPSSPDRVYSREVARRIGSIQYAFSPDAISSWIEHFSLAVSLYEGHAPALHAHILMLLPTIQQHADVVLDGLAADAIFGGWVAPEMLTATAPDDYAAWLAETRYNGGFPRQQLSNLLPGRRFATVSDHVLDSIRQAIQESGCDSLANIGDYVMYTQRVRRFTNLGNVLLRSGVEVRTPFFDYDLIDFVLSIPPHLRYGQRLYRDAIRGLFPNLRDVPFTPSGQRLTHSSRLRRYVEKPRKLAEDAVPRFLVPLTRQLRATMRRNRPVPSVDYARVFQTELEHVCREYMDSRLNVRHLFNPDIIEGLIAALSKGPSDRIVRQLAIWLTVEMYRDQYGFDRLD